MPNYRDKTKKFIVKYNVLNIITIRPTVHITISSKKVIALNEVHCVACYLKNFNLEHNVANVSF